MLYVSIDITALWHSAIERLPRTKDIASTFYFFGSGFLRREILLRRLPDFGNTFLASLGLVGREHPKADIPTALIQIGNTALSLLTRTVQLCYHLELALPILNINK